MVLNTRAFTTCERKASRLQTYFLSGMDSFASLSLLLGPGKVREMRKSQLVSAPVQPHPGPDTHLLLDEKKKKHKPKNNLSWPPHPGPWETTSNSRTNLSHLLQMSDGKAAVLRTPLLPPSQRSLWILLLSCNAHSCPAPPQLHSACDPEGPAALPSRPRPPLWGCAGAASSTRSQLPASCRGSPPLPLCLRGRTQPARCSEHAASQPRQRRHCSFNFSPLSPPHWPSDFVTDAFCHSL